MQLKKKRVEKEVEKTTMFDKHGLNQKGKSNLPLRIQIQALNCCN
jgi:hypothetical protein